jgi:hypothetical protein
VHSRIGGTNIGIKIAATTHTPGNNTWNVVVDDLDSGTLSQGIECQPVSSSGSWIAVVVVSNSLFTQSSAGTYTGGGLYYDAQGVNAMLDTVRHTNVTSQGWLGYGLQLNTGQSFTDRDGLYAGNTLGGVLISGSWGTASFYGTDLRPVYNPGGGGSPITQPVAVVIGAGASPTDVNFYGAKMRGYGQTIGCAPSVLPVSVLGTPVRLHLWDCPGYNDMQATIVTANSMPTSSTSASAKGYYGKSCFTVGASVTSYTKNGVAYTCSPGQEVWLDPYDTIFQTGSTNGTWIGY